MCDLLHKQLEKYSHKLIKIFTGVPVRFNSKTQLYGRFSRIDQDDLDLQGCLKKGYILTKNLIYFLL